MPVLEALGTAVPGPPVLQSDVKQRAVEVLGAVAPELVSRLDVFDTVGIRKRHFAMPVDWYVEPHGWGERSAAYASVGLDLLERAAGEALARADLPPEAIDGVVLVSTTGLATPSLDARLVNRMRLRPDVARVPVWGLGCAGGVAGLRLAGDLARANPGKRYLLLAMELCSLAFNLNDLSLRAFVATTLFADGAAAGIVAGDEVAKVGRTGGAAGAGGGFARLGATASHQWPDSEDVMGWDVLDEGLRVVFSRRIPDITRHELAPVVERFLKVANDGARPTRYVFHPGGTKVLEAYEAALGLDVDALATARSTLGEFGNMSSPTVLFALDEALGRREPGAHGGPPRRGPLAPGETALLAALGPGFTAELALLRG